jgi:pyridoxal phosphate enzyme (YggS family)
VDGPGQDEIDGIRAARQRVLARIADACARVGRDPGGVTLVAVSKTVAADRLRAAVAAGLTVLGENRVQEGAAKAGEVPGATWHLVGPLQSNKARRAIETFDVIHTLDSFELAARLDRLASEIRPASRLSVLLQVNVDDDPGKAGLGPGEVDDAVGTIAALPNLEVRGLMTIGRLVGRPEDARPTFRNLRALSERLRASHPGLGPGLSMGMSNDYPIAVEEGATIVRVGQALFGERPAG